MVEVWLAEIFDFDNGAAICHLLHNLVNIHSIFTIPSAPYPCEWSWGCMWQVVDHYLMSKWFYRLSTKSEFCLLDPIAEVTPDCTHIVGRENLGMWWMEPVHVPWCFGPKVSLLLPRIDVGIECVGLPRNIGGVEILIEVSVPVFQSLCHSMTCRKLALRRHKTVLYTPFWPIQSM